MAIHDLADMTWEEVRGLDRARTIAILPIGAVEAHGPHLPLGTDVIIARAMARAGAERLEAQGWRALILPALPYTAAPFAGAFPGTLSVGSSTVTSLLLDLARELTRHGFSALALANAHLDPAHLDAIAQAERRAREERLLPVIHPDVSKKPWAPRLTEEFRSGACHAGRYESSIVLAVQSDLVREDVRKALPPNPASLSVAIRGGAKSFEEANGPRAYFGWPADATAEEGRATIEALGSILAEAVAGALGNPKRAAAT
ncbi:MAG TPA: creatininase family protein [Candidatus Limnocylindrales bacterium]|nr:creatininase family protein [Candidatus Limnocylindrales bacterium]